MKKPAAQASGSNKILMVLGLAFVIVGVVLCAAINILDRKPADFANLCETSTYQIEHTLHAELESGEFCITAKGSHTEKRKGLRKYYSDYGICFRGADGEVVALIVTTRQNTSDEEKFDDALHSGGVCDFDLYLGYHDDFYSAATSESNRSLLERAGEKAKSVLGLEDAQLVTVSRLFSTESPETTVVDAEVNSPRFNVLICSVFMVPLGLFMWFKRKEETSIGGAVFCTILATMGFMLVYMVACLVFNWK